MKKEGNKTTKVSEKEIARLKEKFHKISKNLTNAFMKQAKTLPVPTLTQEDNEDIVLAMQSGDKKLIEDVELIVFFVLKVKFYAVAKKYKSPSSSMMSTDEYVGGEFYMMIHETLPKYNASTQIQTFFSPYAKQLFMKLRAKEDNDDASFYYTVIKTYISRALHDLEKQGVCNVSNIDLTNYINKEFDQGVSVNTISKVREQMYEVFSYDHPGQQIEDPFMDSPEEIAEKEEEKEEFHKKIKQIPDKHLRDFLYAELDFLEEHGTMPNNNEIWEICQTISSGISKQGAMSIQRNAHNALRNSYEIQRRREELPLNHMRRVNDDFNWTQDTDDIIEAFNNGELLFDDEEENTSSAQDITDDFLADE